MRTNRGITLIALVVTIVVLLILAGVSISMLTGENGIITQAQESKLQTEIGKEKEIITLSVSAVRGDKISRGDTSEITSSELQTEIDKYTDEATVTGSGTLTVTYESGRSYEVNQDGNIEQKEDLTPEEANKIVDMLDGNIGVTAGGEVVYIETPLIEGEYTSMDTQNRTIITENGVKVSATKCFADNEGKVYVWGENHFGQLGDGTGKDSDVPICISDIEENVLNGKNIVEIQGNQTKVALDSEGKVYTWGYNYSGQLGNGTTTSAYEPICISDISGNVLNGKNIVEIQGFSTMIAIDDEGKVYTWGSNSYGQLGNGTNENSNEPICISEIEGNALNGKNIVEVQDGIALDSEGKVYTWGYNYYGQLGNGTNENSNVPICISDLENDIREKNVENIYFNGNVVIAIDNEKNIYTWGANWDSQLGNGTNVEYNNNPECISNLENDLKGKKIENVYFAGKAIIALDNEGKVYTWGNNRYWQIGDESTKNIPICISDLSNSLNGEKIVDIKIYGHEGSNVIVLDEEGKVHTWGSSRWGLLGDETTEDRNMPECITEKTESKLYNKNIKKICYVTTNLSWEEICYITEDGEVIYYIFLIEM